MRSIDTYPINFPFGATSAPYSAARPHRGDDRAAPQGTPVVVGGKQIGLVGSTGLATGPHLHLQEWRNTPSDVRKPQNSFKGGKVVATTSSSDFGNYVTIRTEDGWNDTYAHLSRIDVKVGDIIGETMEKITLPIARVLSHGIYGRNGLDGRPNALAGETDDDLNKYLVGKDLTDEIIYDMYNSQEAKNFRKTLVPGEYIPVEEQLYKKKG